MKKIYGTYFMKPWRLILSTLFLMLCCGFLANAQPITIDGNPQDWGMEFNTPTPNVLSTFVVDLKRPDGTDSQFTGGAKDFSDANEMAWSYSQVGDKVEITNAGVIIWKNELDEEVMYFMGDRLSTNGSAEIGFWVFQNGTAPDEATWRFKPQKQIGDLLLLFTFTNGGRVPNLEIYKWLGTDGLTGVDRLEMLLNVTDDEAYAYVSQPSMDAPATGFYPVPSYDDPVFGPWEACNKEEKNCGFYYDGSFVEGMINLTKLGLEVDLCGATFLMETRQSHSLTSMLSDFVGGSIGTTPEIWAQDEIFCLPDGGTVPLELCAFPDDDDLSFEWYSDAGLLNKVGDSRCLNLDLDKTTIYYVTATNSFGCTSQAVMVTAEGYKITCVIFTDVPPEIGKYGEAHVVVYKDGVEITETSGLTYLWSTGETTANASKVTNDRDLTVTVLDENECETTCSTGIPTGCPNISEELGCNPGDFSEEEEVEMLLATLKLYYEYENILNLVYNAGDVQIDDCERSQIFTILSFEDDLGNSGGGPECTVTYTWIENEIELTDPAGDEFSACDFADQAALETAFDDWMAAALLDIETQLEGQGCEPIIDNNWDELYPVLCDGDEVTITWTVSDLCIDDILVSATFTITAAPEIEYDVLPQDAKYSACDFTDQAGAIEAFEKWVAAQEEALNLRGGCDPKLTSDADQVELADFCAGDEVTVTWTVKDLCIKDIVVSATFTITAAPEIEAFCSNMIDIPQCVTAEEIDELFAAWKDGFYYTGGCTVKDNKDELMALVWSDFIDVEKGGTVSFTYMVWDACSKDEVTCEFTVPQCIITCETAFAFGDYCFLNEGFDRWGWGNTLTEFGVIVQPIYQSNPSCEGMVENKVGTATITYNSEGLTVHYSIDAGYSMSEVHVYVGCKKYPTLKSGKFTVAPGQFTHNATMLDRAGEYTATFTDVKGSVYIIAHAVVCDIKGKTTGEGKYTKAIDCRPKSATIAGLEATDLRVYPNPFSTKVNFEFVSGRDVQARLEIFNSLGQKVTTLMEHAVEAGVLNRVEYQPQNAVSGVMFYRLTLDDDIINGKLLYNK